MFELGWPRLDPAGSRKPTLLSTSARSAETRARRPPSTTWRGRGPVQDRRRADARLRLPGRRDGRSRDAAGRRRQRCGGATIAAGVAKSMRGVLHACRWIDDAMIDVVESPSSLWTRSAYGVNDQGRSLASATAPRSSARAAKRWILKRCPATGRAGLMASTPRARSSARSRAQGSTTAGPGPFSWRPSRKARPRPPL